MRIAFATTQSPRGSTVVGRILPLAHQLAAAGDEVHILVLRPAVLESPSLPQYQPASGGRYGVGGLPNQVSSDIANGSSGSASLIFHPVGNEPFTRTLSGKKRFRGVRLLANMLAAALGTARKLYQIQPDVIVISKPLPVNTLGVYLYQLLQRRAKVVLDADDFELTANVLTSFTQRAAIAWATRLGVSLAHEIVVATPFLSDYFTGLTNEKKKVTLLVTGYRPFTSTETTSEQPIILYLGSLSVSSGHRVDVLPQILELVIADVAGARLIMAGDGDDQAQLAEAFQKKQLTHAVTWYGRFSAADAGRLLTACRVVVDPVDSSITARAKSSFRVVMAMASGRPVVTSNVGVRPLLIPKAFHQSSFAAPGDPKSYAQKIVDSLKREYSPATAQALKSWAATYSWDVLARKYRDILKVI